MIFDKIENYKLYENLNASIAKAFEYIKVTDFTKLELGKHEIDGDNIFAVYQEYKTKNEADCKLEGHKKYIDLQYIISGAELIGIELFNGQEPTNGGYENNDCAFFNDQIATNIKLEKNCFTLFFPDDLHKPAIMIDTPETVRKLVIKICVPDSLKPFQKVLRNN